MLKILTDLLGKAEKESRAGNIALMILGDPILSKVYDRIQAKYSYRAAGAFAEYHRLPNQCSGLCSRQKFVLNRILLTFKRPTDGRLTKIADESACRRKSLFGKEGVIERYDFSYAFSRLQLRCNKMELVQYIPAVERVRQGAVNHDRARRQGFELTSHEFSEYCDRLSRLPSIERGFYSKSRRFAVLGQSPNTAEQPFVNVAGDVPSSLLSKRLCEFMKGGDVIRKRLKRQFEYKDDLIDKKSIEFYDDMIAKIDQLLSV
ncbi:hypothetical protein TELCIR_12939 [Teladorsagia circumcincta]|uniref:Uncharacterized protein n=1 Tax=Teladorsagia circumcincta TaxID=45464 RepID=A0A2G9U5G8_TELCI|nr:hypothetical protein TELCIR_12939 [Teladorsagia circumcincta]